MDPEDKGFIIYTQFTVNRPRGNILIIFKATSNILNAKFTYLLWEFMFSVLTPPSLKVYYRARCDQRHLSASPRTSGSSFLARMTSRVILNCDWLTSGECAPNCNFAAFELDRVCKIKNIL